MFKRLVPAVFGTMLLYVALCATASAATVAPDLASRIAGLADSADVGVVIVTFNTSSGLQPQHLDVLRAAGLSRGYTLQTLGMVAVPATAGQVRALAANPAVRSVWPNEALHYYMHQARVVTGVDRLRADRQLTLANGGRPVLGGGDFSVVINDSGIDATHADLRLGDRVVQNVFIPSDTETASGFTPLVAIENVPNTDSVGHGTHCAGIVGGSGLMSGGQYGGVAPGTKLIGCGSGAVLFVLNSLGGFEYALANQARYNVRVISNSFGSNGAFNPDDPLNVATKAAYDRNIAVVFAAGNSGPGKNTHNRYAKAPWVISVAAGTKEGGLASFSSRGTPRDERLANSDPNDDNDYPTITAPGTGREFESDAAKFTAAIVSVRAITNIFTNGLTDDAELPPAAIPFYTQISGTSMATPFVAGVVALLLDADPTLTPDEIKQILTATASHMPGYDDFEVGAGYVNAYAAVDKAFNRAKAYGSYANPTFNARFTVGGPAPEPFHVDYSPAALPGPASSNAKTFTVQPNMNVLDVYATFDTALEDGEGNTIGLLLTAPDGQTFSSGVALPILDAASRQVVVDNPKPGTWLLEVRGVRGLAAAPNFSLPTSGAAAPGPVDGTITQRQFTLNRVADIVGHPHQADIETALKSRLVDIDADGLFRPDSEVTRDYFARALALDAPLRQTLAAAPRFTDVAPDLEPIAQAVTASGSTLRDFDFTPAGLMSASGTTFNPAKSVTRLDLAVALVRALGHDAEARAKANSVVTYGGLPLADNAQIPGAMRGYVQIALDLGLVEVHQGGIIPGPRFGPALVIPRYELASALVRYTAAFSAGR